MRKAVVFVFLFLTIGFTYSQQYKSHTVAKGENVFRISQLYNTTVEEIYRVNPTAKNGVKEGEILAIPVSDDQEYSTHIVEEGDTVFNLSQKYGVTKEAIYALNPGTQQNINVGQVIKIKKLPKTNTTAKVPPTKEVTDAIKDTAQTVVAPPARKVVSFTTHKVKKKETLFGIGKQYGVSVDEIKKHNKRLYSEGIMKKDKIRIPIYSDAVVTAFTENTATATVDSSTVRVSTTTKYILQPKDTKFSISRRHGITISELEALNPGLDPNFPTGAEIIVPTTVFVPLEEAIDQEKYELYEVAPQETVYGILKRTNITADSLFSMNPYVRNGLRAGMVITLPKQSSNRDSLAINFKETKADNLENMLSNFQTKKIAVMLPFGLDTLDIGSRAATEEYLKRNSAKGARVALDFYKGVRIAVDSAKTKGLSIELSVYDTQKKNNAAYIKNVITANNFDELDAVIGPLYQANVEVVASELKKYDTPVFSPISSKESTLYSNFFQTIPTKEMLQDKLMSYIAKDSTEKNIIIITQRGKKHAGIRQRLVAKFPAAKEAKIEEGNYLHAVNLAKVLDKNKPNWVILESDDIAMISNVSTQLNAKVESHQITLFTTHKDDAFDDDSIKNEYLSKLHLHYPSIDKEYDNYSNEFVTPFVARYKKQNGIIPNKYAVRGFDITYDILMRLGTADDLYHAASFEGTTEYVENKFNYAKKRMGGYYNKASYLIKFDDDLKLTIVE